MYKYLRIHPWWIRAESSAKSGFNAEAQRTQRKTQRKQKAEAKAAPENQRKQRKKGRTFWSPRLRYARSSLRIGRRRIRLPVAWKIALQTAGAMPGVLASPAPPEAAWLLTMWTSTTGISS